MFGAFGGAVAATSVTFVSAAAEAAGVREKLGLTKRVVASRDTRTVDKTMLVHNGYLPDIEVDPETYEVRVDGCLITSTPARELPMAQRYFLF
jgi:urease subunit alpha